MPHQCGAVIRAFAHPGPECDDGSAALKVDDPWDNPLNVELPPYELKVLRSHANRPLREGQTDARLKAQIKLSRPRYLELKDGLYQITSEGRSVACVRD